MRASSGVWHTGGMSGTARTNGFQLWVDAGVRKLAEAEAVDQAGVAGVVDTTEDEEEEGADQQIAAQREHSREPAAQGDHDDFGNQIRRRDPSTVVEAGADAALDVRQRGTDHLNVEDGQKGPDR